MKNQKEVVEIPLEDIKIIFEKEKVDKRFFFVYKDVVNKQNNESYSFDSGTNLITVSLFLSSLELKKETFESIMKSKEAQSTHKNTHYEKRGELSLPYLNYIEKQKVIPNPDSVYFVSVRIF